MPNTITTRNDKSNDVKRVKEAEAKSKYAARTGYESISLYEQIYRDLLRRNETPEYFLEVLTDAGLTDIRLDKLFKKYEGIWNNEKIKQNFLNGRSSSELAFAKVKDSRRSKNGWDKLLTNPIENIRERQLSEYVKPENRYTKEEMLKVVTDYINKIYYQP